MATKPYFNDERAKKAQTSFKFCGVLYGEEITNSVRDSKIYRDNNRPKVGLEMDIPIQYDELKTEVKPITTTEGAINFQIKKITESNQHKIAILNFADFLRPGGGYLQGAMAQEEALCTESFLCNVLTDKKFEECYLENRSHMANGKYTNWAIYSPNIRFQKGMYYAVCDVITCAAPNLRYWQPAEGEYEEVINDRCKFILDIAETNGVSDIVLGAFGCGIFKNDPAIVAKTFNDLINSKNYTFKNVMYAIPGGENYDRFKEIIKKEEWEK